MTAHKHGFRGGTPPLGRGRWLTLAVAMGVASWLAAGNAAAGDGKPPASAPGKKTDAKKSRTSKPAPKGSSAPKPELPELPPLTSDTLTERARLLFDAVASGKPEIADPFFFPREPFLPLKDVDEPGRYHDELVRQYHRDILRLHAKRRSWEGARFVRFTLGSPPRFIEPGREWNKIGYYRTFDAKLAYEVSGKPRTLIVRTIISWGDQWYVTHLTPTKH